MLEARRGLGPVVERFDLPRSITGGEGEREKERGIRAELKKDLPSRLERP